MGSWAPDPFGNDSAGDWKYGLDDVHDLSLIEETIDRVIACGDDYLEAPEAEEAIAAIDVLARLKGRFYERNAYTESVDAWVAAHPIVPPPALIGKARQALDRIATEPSELLGLWQDSDHFEDWKRHVAELRTRIQ